MDDLNPSEKRNFPLSEYNHRVPQRPFSDAFVFESYLYAGVGTIVVCFLGWKLLGDESETGAIGVLAIVSIWGLFGKWRSITRWMEIHETRNEIDKEAKRITYSDDSQKRVLELESHLRDLEAQRDEWLKAKPSLRYRFLQRSERHQWEHWPLWNWYLQKSEELRMIHAVKVNCLLVHETQDGVLICQRQRSSWIPRSQIQHISKCSTEDSGSVDTIVTMPCWFAEEEELDYK
jgi:hypothetical protein